MVNQEKREPLRGAVIAVVAAAIGAAGTLAGNYLASLNAQDQLAAQIAHENSVRRDDLRRDSYRRFISVATKYQTDLGNFTLAESQADSSRLERELANDVTQIQSVWSEIQLVGSDKAADLALEVRDALNDITRATGSTSGNEIRSRVDQTFPKLQLFTDAAHDELNR
jgi:hypothetical protein